MNKTLGQTNYEAYCGQRGWKAFEGQDLPQWPDVKPEIQAAWETAAQAVAKAEVKSLLNKDQLEVLALLKDPARVLTVCRVLQEAHGVALALQRAAAGQPAPQKGG